MKTCSKYSCISITLFLVLTFAPGENILAQVQKNIVVKKQCEGLSFLPLHCLTMPAFDTLRPALVQCGKGLKYYDCICQKRPDKRYAYENQGKENPFTMKASFSDLELEILNQNLLFIDKQYQIQIKEWIRMDKMDLNLGEAIKGFYMKPVF